MNTISWDNIVALIAVIVSALTTLTTYNLRLSIKTLKELTNTVQDIQLKQAEQGIKLEYLEKSMKEQHNETNDIIEHHLKNFITKGG